MLSYKNGDYDKAKSELLLLVKNKSIKGDSLAKALHHLGIISYIKKNCDEALVYFSKVFTSHSKSAYTPNSLLHIAKCLKEQNKNEEAKEALNELITKYPYSKRVKPAKQLLSEIK
jgi:TolA-binding protein